MTDRAARRYENAIKRARYCIHYRIDGVPLDAIAFDHRHLLTVLLELARMRVGAVAVHDRKTGRREILPGGTLA